MPIHYCFVFESYCTVINELEGLSRGAKSVNASTSSPEPQSKNSKNSQLSATAKKSNTITNSSGNNYSSNNSVGKNIDHDHHAAMVATAAQNAMSFLKSKHPAVK